MIIELTEEQHKNLKQLLRYLLDELREDVESDLNGKDFDSAKCLFSEMAKISELLGVLEGK